MAELAKKLHFLKDGTEQTAKAYSTTDEAGSTYVNGKIDGMACYIPIGAVGDAMTTNGRVKKNGTDYAIKSQSKPPYTEVSYTTAGTYTFTVPNNVNRIRVACVGGGGGGSIVADDDDAKCDRNYTASSGGASSFGSLISASGGSGGHSRVQMWHSYQDEDGGNHYQARHSGSAGAGGSPNGNSGGYTSSYQTSSWNVYENFTQNKGNSTIVTYGGAGFSLSFTKTSGDYGKGGYVSGAAKMYSTGTHWAMISNAGGGSGGYNTGYYNVTPGQTYSITVGAGANSIASYVESCTPTLYHANSGFVLVAYGGDI